MCTGSQNYFGIGNGFPRRINAEQFSAGASQVALVVKNLPASAGDPGDLGSVSGSGRSPGGGNDNPLQYSRLEYPMDRGAWWATVHGVAKGQIQLSTHTHTHTHTHTFSSFVSVLECTLYLSSILLLVRVFHHLLISDVPYSPAMNGLLFRGKICLLNIETLI